MCFLHKYVISNVRNNFFLIFGLFLGVALSSFVSQIIQNGCVFTAESDQFYVKENWEHSKNDDYEPVINLAGKPLKAQKTPKDFQRPRYYKTELGIRDKLLAAILTSPKTIREYGIAFNTTTNHLFDKTVFFMESEPNKSKSDVRWNGVVQFSDSRIVLKPFHMLKYIIDNFLDDFDYFFLVRDRTYVRGRELYNIVKKISVSEIVHAGSGKLDADNKFCSLNSGILLSNVVLQKIGMKLDWCIKNAFLGSDDTNLGRCIVYASGIGCKNSVQGLTFSTYTLNDKMKDIKFMKLNKTFNSALTFWPVSSPDMLLNLHAYFAKIEIMNRRKQIEFLRNKIVNQPVVLPDNTTVKLTWPIGTPPPMKPVNRFDLLRWDYFTEKQIFLKTDFRNVDELMGADLLDIKYIINASAEFIQEKYNHQFSYKRLVNGYRRFDPSRGMDYILDVAFVDAKTGREVQKRIEICKPLGKVELVTMPYVTENTRVNMVVMVNENNKKNILKFMENYVAVCMEKKDKTFLMLILLYGAQHPGKGSKDDIFGEVKNAAVKHSDRFKRDNNKIAWLSVKLPDESVINPAIFPEERMIALNEGLLRMAVFDLVVKKFSPDNLILHCTSNMEIRQDYLNRVRMNTIKEHQVFSPIPFTEYDPNIVYTEDLLRPKELDINRNYGHFDSLNTEHISFYIKDYKEARKRIEEYIPLIHTDRDITELLFYLKKKLEKMGLENGDVRGNIPGSGPFLNYLRKLSLNSMYTMFVGYDKLHILRAVEPGLRLRHVMTDCQKIFNRNDILGPSLNEKNTGCLSSFGLKGLASVADIMTLEVLSYVAKILTDDTRGEHVRVVLCGSENHLFNLLRPSSKTARADSGLRHRPTPLLQIYSEHSSALLVCAAEGAADYTTAPS